ncbi:hypothetical protein HanHA300_Chr01g0026981 [Helianthus annuus]|nr:hypothetical protein HanHA300_Chr01g0026981 [Helianthus annuus]KAJ0627741.1 hypothetical protein HanHA89_Chr01g0029171 [Helianthus annuus]
MVAFEIISPVQKRQQASGSFLTCLDLHGLMMKLSASIKLICSVKKTGRRCIDLQTSEPDLL